MRMRDETTVKLVTLNAPLGTSPSLSQVELETQNKQPINKANQGRISDKGRSSHKLAILSSSSQLQGAMEQRCELGEHWNANGMQMSSNGGFHETNTVDLPRYGPRY